jgi:enoyl-[acyl-carrier-protein] reductase (NADH)
MTATKSWTRGFKVRVGEAAADLAVTATQVEAHGRRCATEVADVRDFEALAAGIDAVDVANASLFLASEEARNITAVAVPVDAGSTQR